MICRGAGVAHRDKQYMLACSVEALVVVDAYKSQVMGGGVGCAEIAFLN